MIAVEQAERNSRSGVLATGPPWDRSRRRPAHSWAADYSIGLRRSRGVGFLTPRAAALIPQPGFLVIAGGEFPSYTNHMPSIIRPGRRGPIGAMAFLIAAGLGAQQAAAQAVTDDRADGSPSPRDRAARPAATWAVPVAPPSAVDSSAATFESRLDRAARRRGA